MSAISVLPPAWLWSSSASRREKESASASTFGPHHAPELRSAEPAL
jgi:hypothetical protein